MEYGEKTENHGKWEIHTLGREIWRGKLKKMENLQMSTVGKKTENHGKWVTSTWRLKNDEMTEKLEKWEMHSVGPGIWRENWQSQENEKYTL